MHDCDDYTDDVASLESELLTLARQYSFRGRIDKTTFSGPVLVSAKGSIVTDIRGKEYLDFNSGQACAALGHNHPRIVEAIHQACSSMLHSHSSIYNLQEIRLATKLAAIMPDPLRKSLFGESGSDANELAILVARLFTGGKDVFSPHVSYHGLSSGSRSITFAGWRRNHGPLASDAHAILAPYCYRCPLAANFPSCDFACLRTSFELIDAQSSAQPAAVITETLFSAGGVINPPAGWLARLRKMCADRGMLLILDEEQTGLGKLGTMFGFERDNIVPDIVTLAKHFGGGVGVSSMTTSAQIEETVVEAGLTVTRSHSNDPLLCAAGLASLEVVEAEDVPARSRSIGELLLSHLWRLADKFELIGDVRGCGSLIGIELVLDRETKEPAYVEGQQITQYCLDRGLIFSSRRNGSVLRFMPPSTTTPAQIDQAMETLQNALAMSRPMARTN